MLSNLPPCPTYREKGRAVVGHWASWEQRRGSLVHLSHASGLLYLDTFAFVLPSRIHLSEVQGQSVSGGLPFW